MHKPPLVVGAVVLGFLLMSANLARARIPHNGVEHLDEDPSAERVDELEAFKLDQRKRLAEGVDRAKLLVFVPLVVGLVVALILLFTPSELYKIRPFDKNRDRKRPAETPEQDTGYKDSDFNW